MVENQHGLGSILSFSAKSVNPEILEALLVGRKKIVDQLESRVKNIAKDGLNHQVLIVGARGTGKTHVLSVLHHRTKPFIKNKKIKVAYFAEEEYGISGYLDFMVRILNAFIRWNEEDADYLKEQLTILQETPSSYQEETIKKIISDYINDKPLLILAENFNDILKALSKSGQSKLRNWLQSNDRISIIATSQALSDDIGKEDKPFYGFFDEINIKPLTLEQSFELLKSLAKLEKREDVIEHLENKGKAQVMAINSLVKGNHRLLITFYEFLKSDVLSNLSVMFIKTLNDLKPYYETFIRYQQPQQQKIIRFLALSKTPRQGTEIARECFIEQKSLSKQMSELARKKLVDVITDPDDKRNKLYDISEPLLRISIEIGEHKEGISALFIDFLALYYDQNELNNQKKRFSEIYKDCLNPKEKEKYGFEISARESALKIQEQLELDKLITPFPKHKEIVHFIHDKKYEKARTLLNAVPKQYQNDSFYYLRGGISIMERDFVNGEIFLEKAIEINPKREHYFSLLGDLYRSKLDYERAIIFYEKGLDINGDNEEILSNLIQILYKIKDYEKCVFYGDKIIKENPENDETWFSLALSYEFLGEKEKAIDIFERGLKINPLSLNIILLLADRYINDNKVEKGVKLIRRIINFKPLEKGFSETYGEYYSLFVMMILKYDKNISIKDCLKIERSTMKNFNETNKSKVLFLLVNVFRRTTLEKNKKALYDLPKEQREFFQKEILDFRDEQHNAQPKKQRKKQ